LRPSLKVEVARPAHAKSTIAERFSIISIAGPPPVTTVTGISARISDQQMHCLPSAAGPLDLPVHHAGEKFPPLESRVKLGGSEWTMVPPCLVLPASPFFSIRLASRVNAAILDVKSFAKKATYSDIPAVITVEAAWEATRGETPVVPDIMQVTVMAMAHPAERRKFPGPPPDWTSIIDRYLADWLGFPAGEEEEELDE
jgi:hypothetical protein